MDEFLISIGYWQKDNGKWVSRHTEHGDGEEMDLEVEQRLTENAMSEITLETIDDDIARAEKAERVELPANKWRDALYKAKAALVADEAINDFKAEKLGISYGRLVEGLEDILWAHQYEIFKDCYDDEIKVTERSELESLLKPIMKWMENKCHPHSKIIITLHNAELMRGIEGFVKNDTD